MIKLSDILTTKLGDHAQMNMKCGRCDKYAPMDTFQIDSGTNDLVCENCFRKISSLALIDAPETPADLEENIEDDLDEEVEEEPEETISQRANRIWRQRQINKLEEEHETLVAELDSVRDDIGYDRITMDEENYLVGETIYGLQIQDRLEEIEKELVLLRSKQ